MAVTAITDFTKYKGKISNSGHDERGRYSGGKAGDQSDEWCIRNWYSRPWNTVIRFTDRKIANMLATVSIYAAQNNKIGYDQGQRTTYWTQLQKVGYDPRKIATACEADCSAGVLANVRAALELTGHGTYAKKINIHGYTGNEKSIIKNCGAKVQIFTTKALLTGTAYLMPGDILLNTNAHTAVNLGIGSKVDKAAVYAGITTAKASGQPYTGTLPKLPKKDYFCKGDTGEEVKKLQKFLRWYGTYKDTIDGSFGNNTDKAVRTYQANEGLQVDGLFGPKSLAHAKKVKK